MSRPARISRFTGQSPARPVAASTPTTAPVATLAHHPGNPRDDYGDVAELADSIAQVGVLQPLGVVDRATFAAHHPQWAAEVDGATWVVMNGNRRLAAARAAGLDEVPIYVLDIGDQLDDAVLIENIHRAELPPLREAEAIRTLVERHGSQRAVAKRIAKTQAYVSQRLALTNLHPDLKAALEAGELLVRDARKLGSLPVDEQLTAWRRADNPVITGGDGSGDDGAGGGDNRVITPASGSGGRVAAPGRSWVRAARRFHTATRELVDELATARAEGASEADLRARLDRLAADAGLDVSELPVALFTAAGLTPPRAEGAG